jgi:hypothetical protein
MGTGKSTEYFPHDCNAADDPKIMLLMAQLGPEAYGIYWILVEYLRKQPQYVAPMILLDPLSRRYGSSREKFEAVVTKFGLFEFDNERFSSPSLTRRMAPLDSKRSHMQELANIRWKSDDNADAMRTHNEGNAQAMQSRVKKSRVKKSKEEKSKEKKSVDFSSSFSDDANQILIQKWGEWKKFRNQLKKPYKTIHGESVAYNKLVSLASSNSVIAIQIIQQSIDNEWLGFFPLKAAAAVAIPGEDIFDKQRRELKEARERRLAREAAEKPQTNGN